VLAIFPNALLLPNDLCKMRKDGELMCCFVAQYMIIKSPKDTFGFERNREREKERERERERKRRRERERVSAINFFREKLPKVSRHS